MTEKIAGTMHTFGIIFLIGAIIIAIFGLLAAKEDERVAAELARELFKNCLFFGLFLWIIAWLIC